MMTMIRTALNRQRGSYCAVHASPLQAGAAQSNKRKYLPRIAAFKCCDPCLVVRDLVVLLQCVAK